jgi:hypothetical protein
VKVEMNLTTAEAVAILSAELSRGHGVRRSKALVSAEGKLRAAILANADNAREVSR